MWKTRPVILFFLRPLACFQYFRTPLDEFSCLLTQYIVVIKLITDRLRFALSCAMMIGSPYRLTAAASPLTGMPSRHCKYLVGCSCFISQHSGQGKVSPRFALNGGLENIFSHQRYIAVVKANYVELRLFAGKSCIKAKYSFAFFSIQYHGATGIWH